VLYASVTSTGRVMDHAYIPYTIHPKLPAQLTPVQVHERQVILLWRGLGKDSGPHSSSSTGSSFN
jgi:hypothetical protein